MIGGMRRRVALSLLPLLFAGAAFAAAPAKKLAVPPIPLKHRTLANGLEVISVEDHSSPTVAIQVWYRVGSKNDPQGRSGFAHLFEHLMFKSTAHMPAEMMDRLTEDVGGFNNASTRDDATEYHEVVPSNYLETLLWAEGDRMASLNVNEDNFKSERDVVKEEYRFRVLSPPYGRLFSALEQDSWAVHPYKRPGIGNIAELDAATLADVQAFHKTFYRPDNAVLIVVGDFDPAQLQSWVDKYLGVIGHPSTPIPRVTAKEPPRKAPKRFEEHGPNVPLPAVAVTWLLPEARHADTPALSIVAALLGLGQSSRVYESLVYEKKVAAEIEVDADLREDASLFIAFAVLANGHSASEGEKALIAEIDKLVAKPVPASELDKAKTQLIASILHERENNDGKAFAIGNSAVVFHDADAINTWINRLQAVTSADVQRVVRKYITGAPPVLIHYTAEGGAK
jgi:zinc protease